MYGQCETYGKASLMMRCKQVFQKRRGYVLMGVPLSKDDWKGEY